MLSARGEFESLYEWQKRTFEEKDREDRRRSCLASGKTCPCYLLCFPVPEPKTDSEAREAR